MSPEESWRCIAEMPLTLFFLGPFICDHLLVSIIQINPVLFCHMSLPMQNKIKCDMCDILPILRPRMAILSNPEAWKDI